MFLAQIQLSLFDYVTVGLYAAVVIALGVWFAREQKTSTDYILAGRSMGWIVVGISQLASLLSASAIWVVRAKPMRTIAAIFYSRCLATFLYPLSFISS